MRQILDPFHSPPRRQANQPGLNFILLCPHPSVSPPSSLPTFLLPDLSSSIISTFCTVLSWESSHPLSFEVDCSFPMLRLDSLSSLPGSLPWAFSLPAWYSHIFIFILSLSWHIDIHSVYPSRLALFLSPRSSLFQPLINICWVNTWMHGWRSGYYSLFSQLLIHWIDKWTIAC